MEYYQIFTKKTLNFMKNKRTNIKWMIELQNYIMELILKKAI